MKVGYYGIGDIDMATDLLNNYRREGIPLIRIEDKSQKVEGLDYFIIGGAPIISYPGYWEKIKEIANNHPKTNLFVCSGFNSIKDLEEIFGQRKNIEFLSLNEFPIKLNGLIDKAQ